MSNSGERYISNARDVFLELLYGNTVWVVTYDEGAIPCALWLTGDYLESDDPKDVRLFLVNKGAFVSHSAPTGMYQENKSHEVYTGQIWDTSAEYVTDREKIIGLIRGELIRLRSGANFCAFLDPSGKNLLYCEKSDRAGTGVIAWGIRIFWGEGK